MPGLFRKPPFNSQRQRYKRRTVPPPEQGRSVYRDAVLALNPIGYWRFGDAGGETTAAAVVGPNLTYVNSPGLGASGIDDQPAGDNAVLFTRASSQYAFTSSTTLAAGADGVSVAAWVQFGSTAAGETHTILSWGDQSGASGYHWLYYDVDAAAIRWQYADGSIQFEEYGWVKDTFLHLVVVTHDYTNEVVRFYLDGDEVAVADTTGTEIAVASGEALRWGGYVGSGHEINAVLDEPAIFGNILNATEIEGLYRVGFGGVIEDYHFAVEALGPRAYWRLGETVLDVVTDEANGFDGAYFGPTKGRRSLVAGSDNAAVQFDGQNDYVAGSADDLAITNDYSMLAWFQRLGPSADDYHTLIEAITGYQGTHHPRILVSSDGTTILVQHTQTDTTTFNVSDTITANDGKRHMYAATFDGSTVRAYFDGVEVGTAATGVVGTAVEGGENWVIGRFASGVYAANGIIDEVAVWDSALAAADLSDLYRYGLGAAVISGETAQAGLASGTGAAYSAYIKINAYAAIASGTGAAGAAWGNVKPNAAISTGTGASNGASIHIKPFAGLASGTGAAGAAYVNDQPNAAIATGTGLANNVIPFVKPNAGLASGTGSAHSPPVHVQPRAEVATGTGQAYDATAQSAKVVDAGLASGTGSANQPYVAIAPRAELASGTGTAHNAQGLSNELTPAEAASGSGAAYTASIHIKPNAGLSSGTGSAGDVDEAITVNPAVAAGTGVAQGPYAHVQPNAGQAAGTGAALGPTPSVKPNAGIAAGTGTAYEPPIEYPPAGLAAGTGAAYQPIASVAPNAGLADGSGVAQAPSAAVSVNAGLASGTGTAYEAAAYATQYANAQLASGTGSAYGPSPDIRVNAEVATGTGDVQDPTVNTSSETNAAAGHASGSGTAHQPSIAIAPRAESAAGTGSASGASARVDPSAGSASGVGSASGASTSIAPRAELASGAGTAHATTPRVAVMSGVATATGAAYDATASTQSATYANAGHASGTGTANRPYAHVVVNAGHASGTGTAYDSTATTLVITYAQAQVATGTGAAGGVSAHVVPRGGLASGTGDAGAHANVKPQAELASGTGQAYGATVDKHFIRAITENLPTTEFIDSGGSNTRTITENLTTTDSVLARVRGQDQGHAYAVISVPDQASSTVSVETAGAEISVLMPTVGAAVTAATASATVSAQTVYALISVHNYRRELEDDTEVDESVLATV